MNSKLQMMARIFHGWRRLFFCTLCIGLSFGTAAAQSLTVEVGVPPSDSVTRTNWLVSHDATWRWRRGTNEPSSDWKTVLDAGLDTTWQSGVGGFGYGDPGILGEATTVPGMNELHTTFYLRREFQVSSELDAASGLFLTVDYDDGFVAYLDGLEVARANAPGSPGSAIAFNALATGSHEASCCNAPTSVATNISLGSLGSVLSPGSHTLAFIGLNRALTNSDFHLIPDLSVRVSDSSPSNHVAPVVNHGLYALSITNQVRLAGSNTVSETSRVVVNGLDADWDPVNQRWSRIQGLVPGMNRLFIAALDARGRILADLSQDIVYQTNAIVLEGPLNRDRILSGPGTVVQVNQDVQVGAGLLLRILEGVVLRLDAGVKLTAHAGGRIQLDGTRERPIWGVPTDGSLWGELAADGAGAALEIRHADLTRGAVKFRNGAIGLMEDSFVHSYKNGTVPIAGCTGAAQVTVRRCHFQSYHETLWQSTPMLVEDSLFEDADNANSDALDFDTAPPGSVIRRCTFRRGPNTNTDACDIGSGSKGVLIERCIMRGFPNDKGVSIGEDSFDIVVRNNVMWGNDSGVAVKDSCTAVVEGNTIVDCDFGLRLYNKANPGSATGGGHISSGPGNIIWGNRAAFELLNGSTLVLSYSDLQDSQFPGVGNISTDPLFVDSGRRDYRLQAGSPCRSSGPGGTDMGATGLVGGIPVEPTRLAATDPSTSSILLTWEDRSDNEEGTVIERSRDGALWQVIGIVPAETVEFRDVSLVPGSSFFYRVSTTNTSGVSSWSHVARGDTTSDQLHVGGILKADVTWKGIILVDSNVTVPGPFTLRVDAGSSLRIAAGASLTATAGGAIDLLGTAEAPIRLAPSSAGTTRWGDLLATGAGSRVKLLHGQVFNGRVRVAAGGAALVEDSELSQMTATGIIGGNGGASFVIRRSHVHDYEDVDLINTVPLAEDSLFERARSDIFELQNSPTGSVIRRCVFRDCLNPNSDGIDMNGCRDVRIESCRVYRVTDKGISSGSASSASDPTSTGLVITNTVVYQAAIGVAVKDGGTASLYHNAFSQVTEGIAVYAKFTKVGGAIIDGSDNIIWGVTNALRVADGGSVILRFSDVQGGWAGEGNMDRDPLWADAAAGDFHLAAGSPCVGSGSGGRNMGPVFSSAPLDSDGDGMPDDFETLHHLNPLDPSDASLDLDGDGATNWQEFYSGTDPGLASSRLELAFARGLEGKLLLRFQAQPGIRYALSTSGSLQGPWRTSQDLGTRNVLSEVTVELSLEESLGFYRVLVVLPAMP